MMASAPPMSAAIAFVLPCSLWVNAQYTPAMSNASEIAGKTTVDSALVTMPAKNAPIGLMCTPSGKRATGNLDDARRTDENHAQRDESSDRQPPHRLTRP